MENRSIDSEMVLFACRMMVLNDSIMIIGENMRPGSEQKEANRSIDSEAVPLLYQIMTLTLLEKV